jgi:flavin reductase (DIM6/NTAB) family NADH-FMN oxidoreductase RutF
MQGDTPEMPMPKKDLGKRLPPMALPVCLVGAQVEGRPNFCTIAWFTIIDDEPPMIGLVMAKKRRTKDGMFENGTFSVNIPDRDQVVEADYCGIRSGYTVDKSEVFNASYGTLKTAPMIDECPVSMECKLSKVVEMGGVDLVIGEIEHVYVEEGRMSKGKPDPWKVDPVLLWMSGGPYLSLGEKLADAYKVGKGYKKKVEARKR